MTRRGARIALLPKPRTCWPYICCIFFFTELDWYKHLSICLPVAPVTNLI